MARQWQLWLHKNWRDIRSWFITFLCAVILFGLFLSLAQIRAINLGRQEAVDDVIDEVKLAISELKTDNATQTEKLEHLEFLTQCLLVSHDVSLNVDPAVREQCQRILDTFPSPSPSNINNQKESLTTPQDKAPEEGDAEEPSFLELLLKPITDIID